MSAKWKLYFAMFGLVCLAFCSGWIAKQWHADNVVEPVPRQVCAERAEADALPEETEEQDRAASDEPRPPERAESEPE